MVYEVIGENCKVEAKFLDLDRGEEDLIIKNCNFEIYKGLITIKAKNVTIINSTIKSTSDTRGEYYHLIITAQNVNLDKDSKLIATTPNIKISYFVQEGDVNFGCTEEELKAQVSTKLENAKVAEVKEKDSMLKS